MPVRLWRFDRSAYQDWSWAPFSEPRHRFDSASGAHRVRYGATTAVGAARERYRDTGMLVPDDHADHHVAVVEGALTVLDLRRETILDALGTDDRVSTSREPATWASCQQLTDHVRRWWGTDVHALAYRPRTTPETSTNVAFFANAPLDGRSTRLGDDRDLLDELVLAGGLIVPFA